MVQTAYEKIEHGSDYPAKTSPTDWHMLSEDFELTDNSILTDEQKILTQTTRAFYDYDGKFHSFREVLESSGASIPENMPDAYDDRPTLEEEAKWLILQGRVEEGQWLLNNQLKENEEKQMIKSPGQASLFENLAIVTPGAEELNNKKTPDQGQELNSPAGGAFARNPSSLSDCVTKVAPQPDEQAHPDFRTDDLLQFTIKDVKIQIKKDGYFPIKENELRKLNLIAPSLQKTAQFYEQNLSGSTINYVYKDGSGYSTMVVKFEDENFIHLTGIKP